MQDYSIARRAMVDSQLRPQGVTDRGVLAAMGSVGREHHVPEAVRDFAYFDRPLKIGEGRTMMPPAALGRLLSELAPVAGEKALIVGAGTGYSAAVLSAIGLKVTAIESDADLVAMARAAGIDAIQAELDKGHAKGAPYDLILIDGAVEDIPAAIIAQLGEDGRLGTALVDVGVTRLAIGRRIGGAFGLVTVADADVGALPGFERPKVFTF